MGIQARHAITAGVVLLLLALWSIAPRAPGGTAPAVTQRAAPPPHEADGASQPNLRAHTQPTTPPHRDRDDAGAGGQRQDVAGLATEPRDSSGSSGSSGSGASSGSSAGGGAGLVNTIEQPQEAQTAGAQATPTEARSGDGRTGDGVVGGEAGAGVPAAAHRPAKPMPTPILENVAESRFLTDERFAQALLDASDDSYTVVISLATGGYMDVLMNLVHSSIVRWRIPNFLAIVNEGECAEVLKAPFVHCHELANALGDGDYDGKNKEVYYNTVGTKGEINMASVALGFNTLLVDGDIVFLQNPMPLLADMVAKHPSVDAWAQEETKGRLNSGFMLFRSTPASVECLSITVTYARRKHIYDQPAVRHAWAKMRRRRAIKLKLLDQLAYASGYHYYEQPLRRMFFDHHPCASCVTVHNNWVVGTEAKVYRFKEHLQWWFDRDGYYSSRERKYLVLVLPSTRRKTNHELDALRVGLAMALLSGRTLVLPRFRCPRCGVGCAPESDEPNECTLQAWVYVRDLDASGIDYREASFFSHPLVPAALCEVATGTTEKEGLTSIDVFVPSKKHRHVPRGLPASVQALKPADPSFGPTKQEVLDSCGSASVVRLHLPPTTGVAVQWPRVRTGSAVGDAVKQATDAVHPLPKHNVRTHNEFRQHV